MTQGYWCSWRFCWASPPGFAFPLREDQSGSGSSGWPVGHPRGPDQRQQPRHRRQDGPGGQGHPGPGEPPGRGRARDPAAGRPTRSACNSPASTTRRKLSRSSARRPSLEFFDVKQFGTPYATQEEALTAAGVTSVDELPAGTQMIHWPVNGGNLSDQWFVVTTPAVLTGAMLKGAQWTYDQNNSPRSTCSSTTRGRRRSRTSPAAWPRRPRSPARTNSSPSSSTARSRRLPG